MHVRESCIQTGLLLVGLPNHSMSQCNKSTHFMKCKSCCASVLHFPTHKQSHDSMIQKSCAPVTKASAAFFRRSADALLQTWKPWWPKALKVLPLGLPSKTKGLLGLYDAHHQLKYLKDPAHFSETFLGEIDYSKPPHTVPMTAQCHIPAFWDFSARIFSKEPFSAAWSNACSA